MSRNDDQIEMLRESFSLYDNRGDGKVYVNQIGEVLRAMGQNPTEAEVKKCVLQFDPNARVSFEEFIPILNTVTKNQVNASIDEFIEGFSVFDKEQNGLISSAELRHLLTTLGEKLSEEEVGDLLQGLEDTHGNVNYEDFCKSVMSG